MHSVVQDSPSVGSVGGTEVKKAHSVLNLVKKKKKIKL